MIGLNAFNKEQLDAASRLQNNQDFKTLINYLTAEVTELALKSTRQAGDIGEKLKGGCIALQELRDMYIEAPAVIQAEKERDEMALLDRDPISP